MNPYDGPDDADFGPDEDFDPDMITMNPPRWQRWRPARPMAIAGVAIAALVGGAGVGYAATHSLAKGGAPGTTTAAAAAAPTPSASAAPAPGFRGGAFRHAFAGGPGLAFGGLGFGSAGGVVHGQVTVPKSGGGYETVDVQQGTVTAVSSTSITLKSADGYTASYAVSSKTVVDAEAAGIGSVKTGDTVYLTATVSGSTATAASVLDLSAVKAGRASFGFPAAPKNAPTVPAAAQPPTA